ncbi:alpha/beta fold hydrolase [Paracoccus sp. R12_1]|uniref:alpha/beta fold hydrolase n=1 Tax=unclassified Paracoccus (in: a-proteobacteria) TaxID=2688777 RepID=UPI001ADCDF53|nr:MULTISPECIES: alpha/beta fold hydrolase [unclassified Paracoccus (in: a-proteobacteria)]MBO9456380.1 alpha/beta fold hydrolase [Paracoccus sp. R12_2]MBO9487589.1 alpha/beta fold hydrolase [Paracoccus sp. R12_1]
MHELHFEADPAGKPSLLLVHGVLSSRRHWALNTALSRDYRCIRVDLPAHGKSPAPDDPLFYRPDAMVAALDRLRAGLGIDRWFICGQSFGAGLTLRYALTHPDRVIAQGFTNANAALRGIWTEAQRAAHDARVADIVGNGLTGLRRQAFHPAHARRFPAQIRAMLSCDADGCDIPGFVRLMTEGLPNLSVRDRIGKTSVPTLLVNGVTERRFQAVRDEIPTLLPSVGIVDLQGGYSINIEDPGGFDAALTEFFNGFVADDMTAELSGHEH